MEKKKFTLEEIYPLLFNHDVVIVRYSTARKIYSGKKCKRYKDFKDYIVEGIWTEIHVDKTARAHHTFTDAKALLTVAISPPEGMEEDF